MARRLAERGKDLAPQPTRRSKVAARVRTDGNHLTLSGLPFRVKGVTYGSFAPRLDGWLFPESDQIKKDLVAIREAGLNTVRTYTLPPIELLDMAAELGLRVMVGLDYEDWRYEDEPGRKTNKRVREAGLAAVREALEVCKGRPEVLAIAVGNEVPSDVVRAHSISSVEAVVTDLISEVHSLDPDMLATYCNFPTTEYLSIAGMDLACMNVFLEDQRPFRKYIRHLQVANPDVPLLITELGLASEIHGVESQARNLGWQLRILDECGVAGATVFSWTDEWAVAGKPVEGWGFGVTDEERRPKPAFEALRSWAGSTQKDLRVVWPRVSVVVCAYNAEKHIEACLASLAACDYPNLEVLVCDDGSTDETLAIAQRFPFNVLDLPRGGLSRARNAGISASTGEIVAFLDSDAFCHPDWPYQLALSLEDEGVAGTGGPNLPVEGVGLAERAVAESPGGPIHVLLTDDRAEHVPGCNMAFRKDALLEIDGFDPVYTAAGDDVDVCWKLLDAGHDIAFAPSAQVRHHRRDSVRGYLKQQRGYGRAERMVAAGHRHRFNRLGQARWSGFIYGGPRLLSSVLRPLIYHGYQGTAPYQSVVHRPSEVARSWATALLPFLFVLGLMGCGLGPVFSGGWWLAGTCLTVAITYSLLIAVAAHPSRTEPHRIRFRLLVAFMHVAQPLVRAWGRLVTRSPVVHGTDVHQDGGWKGDRHHWLLRLEQGLAARGCTVRIGGPNESWDLDVSRGLFISYRVTLAVLWGWTPVSRTRIRLRLSASVALIPTCVSLAMGSGWQPVVLAASAVLALFEVVVTRRALSRALSATTEDARG